MSIIPTYSIAIGCISRIQIWILSNAVSPSGQRGQLLPRQTFTFTSIRWRFQAGLINTSSGEGTDLMNDPAPCTQNLSDVI